MESTNITIVRHGETEWNIAMRLQGIQNSPLTKRGVQQAKQTAKSLSQTPFDQVISSDLQRALDTAGHIIAGRNIPVLTNKGIRERSFGVMEGLTLQQMKDQYPDVVREYLARNERYQIPQGESLQQFYTRAIKAVNDIVKVNRGKSILIVTHGGVLDCVIRMIFNYPLAAPRTFTLYNAAINEFLHDGTHWKLVKWGDTGHQDKESLSIDEPGK